jgi:hypothetical protein
MRALTQVSLVRSALFGLKRGDAARRAYYRGCGVVEWVTLQERVGNETKYWMMQKECSCGHNMGGRGKYEAISARTNNSRLIVKVLELDKAVASTAVPLSCGGWSG